MSEGPLNPQGLSLPVHPFGEGETASGEVHPKRGDEELSVRMNVLQCIDDNGERMASVNTNLKNDENILGVRFSRA